MSKLSRLVPSQSLLSATKASVQLFSTIKREVRVHTLKTAAHGARLRRGERRRLARDPRLKLLLTLFLFYTTALVLYLHVVGKYVNFGWNSSSSTGQAPQIPVFGNRSGYGYAALDVSPTIAAQQRILCGYRNDAARTIVMHMHIPKSGGTAFAMALKSECRCADIPRPRKGYCKECPHVIPDRGLPVMRFTQNLWTSKNMTYDWPYSKNCRSYYASSRWFGFPKKNRSYFFYSQNRLTSGWPCGVHVGYARLRECCHRLQLPGIKHVIVTLFREPLARFVSEFYQVAYNRRVITTWDWCMNLTVPLTMTQFFDMDMSYPVQSRVTKLLSGSPIQTGAAGEDWRVPGVRARALERALAVIKSTEDVMFGLAEELHLTLEMFQFVFKRTFKAPSTCHSHKDQTGCRKAELGLHDLHGKPLELTEEQERLFSENNREDKILYNAAVKIFWERVEAMRSLQTLGSDLAIDRWCDSILKGDS